MLSLEPGTRLGLYEILAPIGAGGMGEVYRARDTKLNRDVALKLLPDLFANDPDRLARFRREAQVLASLNHPHIGHIYGFEESAEPHVCALVLELVQGEDLSQRLARGAIPLDEALPIAKQIAEALEAAHDQGVVHRDLKPANVKVRDDGTVKVLDFGLAKAFAVDSSTSSAEVLNSPTLTAHATRMGVILGTAAYMAPEQAKGKTVDRRADIWAFGAVLYEMLSGQRVFKGDDISDTLAAVLRQDVDWSALPESTSPSVRRLIARCLERDPKKRLRDIGEARIVLEEPAASEGQSGGAPASAAAVIMPRPLWRRAVPIGLTAIVTAALAATIAWKLWPAAPAAPVTRFQVVLPEAHGFAGTGRQLLALSPDGAHVVYVASAARLYLRSMSDRDPRPIRGTDNLQALASPVFSPDSQSIAFHAIVDNTLKRLPIAGGTPVTICSADIPAGMSWGPDGIVFGQGAKGVMRVSPNGGTPELIVTVSGDEHVHGPQMLPGGEYVLFTLARGSAPDRWDTAEVVVQSLRTRERRSLFKGGSDARYVPTGHLVYAVSGTMFAVPFDITRLAVTGGPVPIIEGVRRTSQSLAGAAQLSFSNNGSLVYLPGPIAATGGHYQIVLADRKGAVTPLKMAPGMYDTPRVSPDGTRVAFSMADGQGSTVWIADVSGTTAMQRMTFGGNSGYPIWTSDGKRIAFQSDRDGDAAIFWQAADGTGSAERLTKPDPGTSHSPESWSPKGDAFLFSVTKGSDVSLWLFSLKDRKATAFADVQSSTPTDAAFSPDGRSVAYVTTQQGTTRIYVQPFPPTGARYQVFAQGADGPHQPVWTRDGKELIYNPRPGMLEAVNFTTEPRVAFGNPVAWARPFETGPPTRRRPFDMTPDGNMLGLAIPGSADAMSPLASQRIYVTLNWFEELKQRVPVGR